MGAWERGLTVQRDPSGDTMGQRQLSSRRVNKVKSDLEYAKSRSLATEGKGLTGGRLW